MFGLFNRGAAAPDQNGASADNADQDIQYAETVNDEFDALYISLGTPDSTNEKYPAKQHAKKVVEQLCVKGGLIYLAGTQSADSEDSDQPQPFRQRRYFFYLSGVDFPDAHLMYDIDDAELLLFIPAPDPKKVIWMGPTPSIQECVEKYDVDQVLHNESLSSYLSRWREGQKRTNKDETIYVLHDDREHIPAGYENDAHVDTKSLTLAMNEARVIKSSYETALLRKANDISSLAHRRVLERLSECSNETHIESIFAGSCIWSGAKKQAYGIIAAAGSNASTLHYIKNDDDLQGRELVCLDAGCEWENYASDVTRTFPISGTMSKECNEIYSVVEEMQVACIELIKPGANFRDLQALAAEIAATKLTELGILSGGSFDERKTVTRTFFPHGLGHHIGLECHDVFGRRPLLVYPLSQNQLQLQSEWWISNFARSNFIGNDARPLEAGMVITVEPGLYFNTYALDHLKSEDPEKAKLIDFSVLARYMKVGGVRIEDDILVREGGYEILTTAPKGEEAFELIRKGKVAALKV